MSPELLILFPISIACDITGQIFFKVGADQISSVQPVGASGFRDRLISNGWIALGVSIYAFEMFVWLRILTLAPLSLAFPIAATNFLGVTFASRYLFKEDVSARQWVGVLLVTLGVIAVAAT